MSQKHLFQITQNSLMQNHHFEIKSYEENGSFSGYASIFENTDSYLDKVAKGAFAKSINLKNKPKMLWQHKTDMPIGFWTKIEENENGLFVEGQLLLDLSIGRECYILLKSGVIDSLSIGFYIKKARKYGKYRILEEIDLREISLVTFGANPDARIVNCKDDRMDYNTINEINTLDMVLDRMNRLAGNFQNFG